MNKLYNFIFAMITVAFFSSSINGQNLVANPSFEEYDTCPQTLDQIRYAKGWSSFEGTPDYFNSCSASNRLGVPTNVVGYQPAHSGSGYAGFVAYVTGVFHPIEYIGRELIDTLIVGQKYFVSLFVSYTVTGGNSVACNRLGSLFTTMQLDTAVHYFNYAKIFSSDIISDSLGWTKIQGSFIADSAYRYIMIGNFFDHDHTDTAFSSPEQPNLVAYYYLDDICVSVDSSLCNIADGIVNKDETNYLVVFPNPANGLMNIQFREFNVKVKSSFRIINNIGQIVYEHVDSNDLKDRVTINTLPFANGIYHIIVNTDLFQAEKTIIISNF